MYQYSCYACSIVYICKYCVCPHGPYGLLDVGIKVSIYTNITYRKEKRKITHAYTSMYKLYQMTYKTSKPQR